MSELLAPHNTPFAVALAVLVLLVLIQLVGLSDFLPDADADFDADLDGADGDMDIGGGIASLIGLGKLPLVVWLSSFLACFALLGLSIQDLVTGLFGAPFPALAASGAALMAAVPVNGAVTHGLSKIWPKDETTAVPIDALVGRRGRIAVGKAQRGNPARATVTDRHGQMHNVMVEPHDDGVTFREGDEVMLVRREGELFYALDGQGPIRLGD